MRKKNNHITQERRMRYSEGTERDGYKTDYLYFFIFSQNYVFLRFRKTHTEKNSISQILAEKREFHILSHYGFKS